MIEQRGARDHGLSKGLLLHHDPDVRLEGAITPLQAALVTDATDFRCAAIGGWCGQGDRRDPALRRASDTQRGFRHAGRLLIALPLAIWALGLG